MPMTCPPTLQQTLQQHLTEREHARCRSLMSDDFASLNELLSDQLMHIHTRGKVDGKPQYLRFAQEVAQVVSLTRGPLAVRQLGADVAVMTGLQTNLSCGRSAATRGAIATTEAQVVQVWAREADGAWRIQLFQGTALPKEQTA